MIATKDIGVAPTWGKILRGEPIATASPAFAGLANDFSCRIPRLDPATLDGAMTQEQQQRVLLEEGADAVTHAVAVAPGRNI